MKRLIFFIAFIFCFLVGKAQFPITQSIGSPTTLVQVPANGGFRAGIINRTFTDTTAANLTYLDAYQGAQIFTTSDAKFWVRNATATGWIDIAGSGSSSQRISALLAANQTNTIDNANYEQLWRWNSLSGKGLRLNSTTTLADEGQNLLEVSVAGANAQAGIYTYGINVSNSHTGGGINVAANFAATGGSSNYAALFTSGNVGIGTSTPAKILHTVGTVRHETLGTASSDTTTNKPLGINSSGDIIPMTYWPGGAGGGITSLNGLSGATQTFATGTSGSDFAISSVGTTHTFNIPTASGSNRGLLSTSDWTTFSNKVGGSGVANQISYWNGSSSLTGDADMTYNSTTNTITMLPNGTDNGQINFSTGYGRTAIMLYDGGAGVRHGWGLQPSEMQFFNPTAAHFSWNLGGDLQTSGTNEIMRLYSPGSMAGQLNLRDPNGTYSGLTNNGGPLTIFGSSTYNDVQVSVGSSTAIRAYHPTSFNYIYLNGQVINNDLTVLSNYVGAYSLQRTVPYAVGGDNYHGYTDNTDFRLGTAAFNSFGSFVTFGNNTTNADHYAAFQNVWKKDSSNTMSKVYGFVNAVSEITGGAITDLYGYYHYSPTITSGTITNQYGVYVPAVTGATNNYGAYFGSNVGIGTATPSTPLHLVNTTEQARIGYDGSNYYKTTVGSTGGVTFDAVGSGANFTFSDAVTLGNLPSGSTSDSVLTDASGAVKHRKVSDLISPYVTTGTYTPTLSNTTNVSASTAYQCQYSVAADASGNQVVTVSGEVDIDPTTTATLTVLRVTLPITSNVGQTYEVGGTANDELGTPARIRGNAANDVAEIRFTPVDVTNRTFSFVFVYKVNIP